MSIIEINQNSRNFSFLALGVLLPFSAAAISIFMILLVVLTLLDKSSYKKLYDNFKKPLFQSFGLFFILHMVGFYWLEVDPINWHKSWMIWIIPILAVAVDSDTARKGVYALIIGMALALLYVYYNIFNIWETYIHGGFLEVTLPISRVAYNPFLALVIGLVLSLIFSGKIKNWRLFVAIIFLISLIVNMFMIGGRAGQIGFIFIWFAISYFYFRGNASKLYIMVMTIVCILIISWNASHAFRDRALEALDNLGSYSLHTKQASLEDLINSSVGLRLHFNEHSLKLLADSPIIGYGTGSFENVFSEYADQNDGQVIKTSNPHSNHMLILVQFGFVGFLIYLNIYYQQIRAVNSMPMHYEFRGAALVLPIFFIVINSYDSYIWGHHTQALFAYITAILYRSDVYTPQESSPQ